MNTLQEAKNRLLEFDIKPSLHRLAIMQYLLMHTTHPTADVIFNDLYPTIPTLSKTTVYNILRLLSDQGAILSLSIDEKNVRYDSDISTHAHFKCKSCGSISDLYIDSLNSIELKNTDRFIITELQLYYKGYCDKCNTQRTQVSN